MAADEDASEGEAPGAGGGARAGAPPGPVPPDRPVVLITRPEPDGAAFAAALRRAAPGPWRAVLAPFARIVPLAAPALPEGAELILTSRNAVRALVASGLPRGALLGRRAWCVGEATADAAREAGLAPVPGAGRLAGTADALVAWITAEGPRAPLLHLRGEHARGDVAARLRAAGHDATEAVIYRQEALEPGTRARAALAGTLGAPVIAPVFSPRAAAPLSRAAADVRAVAGVTSGAAIHAVALSPAVARALDLPGAWVTVCGRPDAKAMIRVVAALLRRCGGGPRPRRGGGDPSEAAPG